jgi:hypothetical protein
VIKILPAVVAVCIACASSLALAATPVHRVALDVDGRDEMAIAGGNLTVQHYSWSLPANLRVDGVNQPLSWNGNTSNAVSVPISGDWWVKKSAGRDGGYATQLANGFALAAADNPNGADTYQFDLYAANDSNSTDWMHVRGGGGNTPGRMSFPGIGGYVPAANGTTTTFSLAVDGTDDLLFTNGQLVIRHVSWSNPSSLLINGQPQSLTWNGNLSNAIALTLPDQFQFTQLGGRTTLYPVETPAGLLLAADDELLGADTYTWKVIAVPEPSLVGLVGGLILLVSVGRRRS